MIINNPLLSCDNITCLPTSEIHLNLGILIKTHLWYKKFLIQSIFRINSI